ncbi:MAG: hypothetical protein EB114_13110 [Betaproteobacteria bacterium]|nr:hypothetical protein [Betaproteobacteria bacterium]
MAYPTVDKPYGLKPINLIGGQVFAGATRQRRIASGASSIGFGDPVIFVSDGTIAVSTSTTAAPATGFAGVFLGCQFVSSVTGQPTFSQAWISGTSVKANTFITAFVCEDPDQLFQVAVVTGTTVVSTTSGLTYTNINNNAALVANTLNTVTYDSQQAILLSSAAVTDSLPIRIVDLVPDTAFTYSGTVYYPEAIVKFNMPNITGSTFLGGHAYYNPTGL